MIVLSDEKSLRSTFLRAIPYMMLAEIVQSLQDVIIQFFLARTVGVDGTAAYGIVYPLLALMIGLSSFLVVGVLTVFSRDMGAGDPDSAALHLSAGITWAFFIMGAFSALCILFRSEPPIFCYSMNSLNFQRNPNLEHIFYIIHTNRRNNYFTGSIF